MRAILSFYFFTAFMMLNTVCVSAEVQCRDIYSDVPFKTEIAKASIWSNVMKTDDSVSTKSKELLQEAAEKIGLLRPPESLCPTNCALIDKPHILFSSTPKKVLESYDDKDVCEKMLKDTSSQPISFQNRRFSTVEDINGYYSNLCQGSGDDGEVLYQKCSSSCSPRYLSFIDKGSSGFLMTTKIVCGHARDKDDDQYELSAIYRWSCEDKKAD